MNFVFVSLQRINTDRESTSTSLAKELAKNHRVLYVDSPIDRKAMLSGGDDVYVQAHIENIRQKGESLYQLQENLWVLRPSRIIESINWMPSTALFQVFNKFNNKRLAQDIKEALHTLNFGPFILINDKDIFRSFYLKELLQPEKYIYLDRDYTLGVDYWRRHGLTLEPKLMQKSDAVVCNSSDFTKRAKQYNPNSFYIGNGGNVTVQPDEKLLDEPTDLAAIPGPRIGYVGALGTDRLDLALLEQLAPLKPQWQFVLIGPEDPRFSASILHQLPNVHFLGKKHTKEVAQYIRHFDVCINPQALNDITKFNFPMKVVEYLALGKPVVGTATNTMTEVFSDHTYLAHDQQSFIAQIEKALQEDTPEKQRERLAFSKKFSWEEVAHSLLQCL